ncbi:hypothetical protein [Bacillus thuringiensis]|uniref:hypothetical protein n=1 Tax=Bacillus thuringiensis TaxID=1428 RepID=UPI0021D68DD4|nr:hypothetical protein [Bacillus thuringiensis]MCU7667746.1 hypothetical protein [Bacillus thuringiensis]
MKKIILSVLLFCLCIGLNLWSYTKFEDSDLNLNFTLNTVIIAVMINLFYGYLFSVLLKKIIYKELTITKQILSSLFFCICVGLDVWSITVFRNSNLGLDLSTTIYIVTAVIITMFYGYFYYILIKKLMYAELKGSKKNVVLMIFLVMVIIVVNFIFFRRHEFTSESNMGDEEGIYICPNGTETMDLSECK